MRDENDPGRRKANQVSDAWLASIARRFLHPIQLLIIDALWRSDKSYSARELAEILEGPAPVQIARRASEASPVDRRTVIGQRSDRLVIHVIASRLFHALPLWIVHALRQEDRSLSARDLSEILKGSDTQEIAFQLRRICEFSVIARAEPLRSGPPMNVRYKLANEPGRDGR